MKGSFVERREAQLRHEEQERLERVINEVRFNEAKRLFNDDQSLPEIQDEEE